MAHSTSLNRYHSHHPFRMKAFLVFYGFMTATTFAAVTEAERVALREALYCSTGDLRCLIG